MYAFMIHQLMKYRHCLKSARNQTEEEEMTVLGNGPSNGGGSKYPRTRRSTARRLRTSGPARASSVDRMTTGITSNKHKRAVVTIGVIVAFHDLMATPCMVTGLVSFTDGSWDRFFNIWVILRILWILNTLVNPFIYAMRIKILRLTLRSYLSCQK
jgi:hypothetical protein